MFFHEVYKCCSTIGRKTYIHVPPFDQKSENLTAADLRNYLVGTFIQKRKILLK